ncbi:hypothetical protein Dda_5664 [Drechslerella dactyloides]|uniref:AA9 family lytic polysaccharide monooxygenase n=1 Tax=Drechslerella dactyloides TaxID=74499 RepID=A0AAD6NIY0_DREDA|nr:hypothetical protein Dda_5664 [Drechslerella dactyloides]
MSQYMLPSNQLPRTRFAFEMKINTKLLLVGLAASSVSAHHVITSFLIDGEQQLNVLRQPGTVSPITDPNSPYLACGLPPQDNHGLKGTEKAIIEPGSKLTFEWHTNWSADTPGPDGVTDASHKGPCAIYMRKVPNSISAVAEDPGSSGWFKVWEDGVDGRGVFCTTRMRENGGFFSGTVPKGLQEGDYLIRAETITLNNAAEPNNEPQCCAQATLRSSPPPSVFPATIRIPSGDYANLNMPGLRYNIWYPVRDSYPDYGPVPGPIVFNGSSENHGTRHPNKHIDDGTTTKAITGSKIQSTSINTLGSTASLPDGFTTIPWPSTSSLVFAESSQRGTITSTVKVTSNMVMSTSTSTVVVTVPRPTTATATETVILDVTKTVYVTPQPMTTAHGHRHGHGHGHFHYITVTVTHVVTQIVYVGGSTSTLPIDESTAVYTTDMDTPTPMPQPQMPTGGYVTATPTGQAKDDNTPGSSLYARHLYAHRVEGYHYRHWHRGHAGLRRII